MAYLSERGDLESPDTPRASRYPCLVATLEDRWHRADPTTGKKTQTELFGSGRRWRVRYRDPSGKNRAPTFERKDDALAHKAEVEGRLRRGTYIDPDRGRVTVGELADAWLHSKAATRKPSTAHSYAEVYRRRVAPRWANVPISHVTHGDIASWVADLVSDGLSPSRVRHAHHVLRSVLALAIRDRRIDTNPADGIDLPALPMRGEHLYIEPAQVLRLADECGHYRPLVLTLGLIGLRWGEAAGLRVGDVDLLRRRLHIRTNLTEVGGRHMEGTPKTHAARWVPMPPQVIEAVEPLLDRAPDAHLFTTPTGAAIRVGNFRRAVFDKAAERVGLAGLHPHSLRHTAASVAVSAGASVKDVQRMLGHARASMTLDVYSDLFEDGLDDLARRIGDAAGVTPTVSQIDRTPVSGGVRRGFGD